MAGELLAGKWKLVYTSNSELYPLLLADELPFVTIGDITQTISADSMEVTNRLAVEVPFLKFGVRAGAALQLRSAKTLDVKFNKTTIETPSVVPSFDLPDAIEGMIFLSLRRGQDLMQQAAPRARLASIEPVRAGRLQWGAVQRGKGG